MCSYSSCQAYDDISSIIRVSDDVLFLQIQDTKGNSAINLTLNPTQARMLGELLALTGEELEQRDYTDELFGNIKVDIIFDN